MADQRVEPRIAVMPKETGAIALAVYPGLGIDATVKLLEMLLKVYPNREINVFGIDPAASP